MKTFNLTATIIVQAESREQLEEIMGQNGNDEQREMVWDLWNSAEVDEVKE